MATTGATEEGRFDQQETVNGKMDVRYYNDTRRWDEPIAFPAGELGALTVAATAFLTLSMT